MTEWKSASSSRDAKFVGWGQSLGQFVEGRVLTIGTGFDMNQRQVPELTVELKQPAASFVKGERTDYPPETVVTVTAGQSNLAKNINKAIGMGMKPGDDIRIELESLFATPKGKAKIFDVKFAEGEAIEGAPTPTVVTTTAAPAQASFGGDFNAEPPF